jgi:methyltransferase-like protein
VVATDDVQRRIVTLLDGTRTPADLLDALVASVEAERLVIVHEGRKLDDRAEIRRALAANLPQELKAAARKGLLIG